MTSSPAIVSNDVAFDLNSTGTRSTHYENELVSDVLSPWSVSQQPRLDARRGDAYDFAICAVCPGDRSRAAWPC